LTETDSTLSRVSIKPFAMIIAAALLALVMIYTSFILAYDMTARNASLIDAAKEIKLEATYGHLWFEEIMSGDQRESIDAVMQHIKNARWFARAMLDGGEKDQESFDALSEPELRLHIEGVIQELETFDQLTRDRYENFVASRPGTAIDGRYDETFRRFIRLADTVETELQDLVKSELQDFRNLHFLLALLVMIIAVFSMVITWRHETRNIQHLRTIHEAQKRLEVLSHTDQLTGVANRRAFDKTLTLEFSRARREKVPLSLIMLDIDFFKLYNDTYGHLKGDECLSRVAHVLNLMCRRPMDLFARYGGEEFAVILPNSVNAQQLAESMREAVIDLAIPHQGIGEDKLVSISLGVAEMPADSQITIKELISRADFALYQAKKNGRNQVVLVVTD